MHFILAHTLPCFLFQKICSRDVCVYLGLPSGQPYDIIIAIRDPEITDTTRARELSRMVLERFPDFSFLIRVMTVGRGTMP